MSSESERLIERYLKELRHELRGLPRDRKRKFLMQVRARIADAASGSPPGSQTDISGVLERLGAPADVAGEAHDFAARPLRRGALEDGALILLSPLVILVALLVMPVLLLGWVVGAIMLWLSRGWTAGEKTIGTLLSGVSFMWAGIGFNLRINDPDTGMAGVVLAVSLLGFFLLVQMVPAIVGVIYLWRKLKDRSAHHAPREVTGVTAASAR